MYNYASKTIKFIAHTLYTIISLAAIGLLTAPAGPTAFVCVLAVWLAYLRLKSKINRPCIYTVFDLDVEKVLFPVHTRNHFVKGDILALASEGDFIVEEVARCAYPEYAEAEQDMFADLKDNSPRAILKVRRIYAKTGKRTFNRVTDLGNKEENPYYDEEEKD